MLARAGTGQSFASRPRGFGGGVAPLKPGDWQQLWSVTIVGDCHQSINTGYWRTVSRSLGYQYSLLVDINHQYITVVVAVGLCSCITGVHSNPSEPPAMSRDLCNIHSVLLCFANRLESTMCRLPSGSGCSMMFHSARCNISIYFYYCYLFVCLLIYLFMPDKTVVKRNRMSSETDTGEHLVVSHYTEEHSPKKKTNTCDIPLRFLLCLWDSYLQQTPWYSHRETKVWPPPNCLHLWTMNSVLTW